METINTLNITSTENKNNKNSVKSIILGITLTSILRFLVITILFSLFYIVVPNNFKQNSPKQIEQEITFRTEKSILNLINLNEIKEDLTKLAEININY